MPDAIGQELKVQPTPFSVWVDLQNSGKKSAPPAFPIWLQSVEATRGTGTVAPDPAVRVYRLRFRRFESLNDELMVRIFFNDKKGASPVVTGWTELGIRVFGSANLGTGLGMDTSETVLVPMASVDYLEVTVPGDGSNIRGAFLSTLQKKEVRQPVDFEVSAGLSDAFNNDERARPEKDDLYLFGRVRATIEDSTIKLEPFNAFSSTFEFELDRRPLVALISFEILDPDIHVSPDVVMNNRVLGVASMFLPDLADPAYTGAQYALESDMRFHYAGWLRCQKVIPGSSLQTGLNRLILQLTRQSHPVAVRAIQIQLKYPSENFDYQLRTEAP